jgi:hypothetical protein
LVFAVNKNLQATTYARVSQRIYNCIKRMVRSKSPFGTKTFLKTKRAPLGRSHEAAMSGKKKKKLTMSQQRKKRFESICSPIGETSQLLMLSVSGCALFDEATTTSSAEVSKLLEEEDHSSLQLHVSSSSNIDAASGQEFNETEQEVSVTSQFDDDEDASKSNCSDFKQKIEEFSSSKKKKLQLLQSDSGDSSSKTGTPATSSVKKRRRSSYEKSPGKDGEQEGFVGYYRRAGSDKCSAKSVNLFPAETTNYHGFSKK